MKLWQTEIRAADPKDGILKSWVGPPIPGFDLKDAEEYLENNDMGYMKIVGQIPESEASELQKGMSLYYVPVN